MNNMSEILGKMSQGQQPGDDQSMAGMMGIGGGQGMGGLLGNLPGAGGSQMQTPTAQGMPQGAAPQQGGSPQAMQMAQMLTQSPTPQTVQMVVAELMKKGTPEAKQIADVLTQVQSSPEGIAKVAQAIMQHMQGGQTTPTDQMGQ